MAFRCACAFFKKYGSRAPRATPVAATRLGLRFLTCAGPGPPKRASMITPEPFVLAAASAGIEAKRAVPPSARAAVAIVSDFIMINLHPVACLEPRTVRVPH